MRIVVFDGHTLNPGDLDWSALEALGDDSVFPRTDPSETVERAAGAEALFLNKAPLTRAMIDSLPSLRYVGVLATGFNIVDTQAAAERGIVVTNVPAYGTASVAQFTFALLLTCHHVGHHASTVRDGRWAASKDFTYSDTQLIELDGLTMGIFGYGRIGRTAARWRKLSE